MFERRSNAAVSVAVFAVIAVIAAALAFQGWKSRIPDYDFLVDIDNAHELLTHQSIPDRGSLASFSSYNTPGIAYFQLLGVAVFKDPRLFQFAGSFILYLGTLLGVFMLARIYLGLPGALLAVCIYGLSNLGLYVAESLWQRYPIHFFYIWMVYWAVQWARQKNSNYLGGAIFTLAVGMYMFLEVAPAFLVLPVVWLLYRPPLRLRPVLLAAVLSVAVWYPYLKFEYSRGFVDVRSQILRKNNLPVDYKQAWCNPNLNITLRDGQVYEATAVEAAAVRESFASKVLSPLLTKKDILGVALTSNFFDEGKISVISTLLAGLFVITLIALILSGQNTEIAKTTERRVRDWLPAAAVGSIALGLLCNEYIASRFLSSDGSLDPSTVSAIWTFRLILVPAGIVLLIFRRYIPSVLSHSIVRLTSVPEPGTRPAGPRGSAGLLVLGFLCPWLLLFLTVEDSGHRFRFWWLWPVQAVIMAVAVIHLTKLFRVSRALTWICAAALVVLLTGNVFVLSKVSSWHEQGWAGADPEELAVVDFVASRLKERRQAAIGYQVFIWTYQAKQNAADPRYKVGAPFDLLFKYRHGVLNTNQCGEGVSPNDEFRIVQYMPGDMSRHAPAHFDLPLDKNFHFVRQIGSYQIFQRSG